VPGPSKLFFHFFFKKIHYLVYIKGGIYVHLITQLITKVVKKTIAGENSDVITIMNRLTRQVKDVKIDLTNLLRWKHRDGTGAKNFQDI
jgi:hypothetical protein